MKRKRIIIHLIQSLNTGGAEQVLLKTLPLLPNAFEHRIITLKEPGELAPRFTEKGIQVINLGSKGFWDLAYRQKLFRFISEQKPSLVLTHLFHADVAGRLLLQKPQAAPVISSIVSTYNFSRYWPARLFEKITRHRAQHYIANSEAVKDFYVNNIGVKANKITVIHNGIDTALFDKATGKDFVKELQLPTERVVITCVANLAINKGHRYLIEAFENLFPFAPSAFLLMAGTGPERENLEAQIESYTSKDHIFLLGRRNDIPDVLAITDIFVLPTLFEGLSNAILEAMAAGCAVVTTDIPENRILIQDQKTGVLVPPQNTAALKESILELIQNNAARKQLGQAARKFAQRHFDLQTIATEFEKALEHYARD